MTFAEFRNLALAIATAADRKCGHDRRQRGISCEVSVSDWDHLPLDAPVVDWDIWDASLEEHYKGGTPEAALAKYRDATFPGAVAEQIAHIGDPDPATVETETPPASESAPGIAGGVLSDSKGAA